MNEKELSETIQITIDGIAVQIPKGTTVHAAAEKLKINVPIFCYHNRMPPFGACRICLVEIEGEKGLKTSCTLEARDGMVVKTKSEKALKGREEIMELLLINHPLDCPICDRGGECPLQEHALHHGPGKSRFYEEKRHFKKAVPKGPVLMLDRERCIACARCTRFGEIVAGDNALEFIHRGYQTEVGTPDGKPVKSKFIGNTIMICPVGALTSQVYRFRARPWDNDSAKTTCTLCPVGCSMVFDSRDGEVMRTRARENKDVNDIWLCDKGWFGYEFSHNPERLQRPLIRKNGELLEASWQEAFSLIKERFDEAKASKKAAAFGGNPLTVEENYLFQKLFREGAKVHHVDHRIGPPAFSLQQEGVSPGMELSPSELEELDFAVLFGLDLTEEFPVFWLRLKQAIDRGAKVFFLGHFSPEIARHLFRVVLHPPGKELLALKDIHEEIGGLASSGKKGAFFVGSQYLHSPMRSAILQEIKKLKEAKKGLSLNILEGSNNSLGARFAGMHPELLPNGQVSGQKGFSAKEVLQESALSGWDLLWVAGADPAEKFPSKFWSDARENLKCLIVQDLFLTKTAKEADVVLPTLSFLEKSGSFINIQGRVSKVSPGKDSLEEVLSDEEIFKKVLEMQGISLEFEESFKRSLQSIRVKQALPVEPEPLSGSAAEQDLNEDQLAATFAPKLFDQGARMDHNLKLRQVREKAEVVIHPEEGKKRGIRNGDLVQFISGENSLEAVVSLNKKAALHTAVFPLGFKSLPAYELGKDLLNGMRVKVVKKSA